MSRWFFEGDDGRAEVLGNLMGQYAEAMDTIRGPAIEDPVLRLELEMAGPRLEPLDPRLERLFPVALDDPEQAAEFRQFAISQQASARLQAAKTVLDAIECSPEGNIVVEHADIPEWVAALSGLRALWHVELVGTSERTATPSMQEITDNPAVVALCDWLAWLIEDALNAYNRQDDQ